MTCWAVAGTPREGYPVEIQALWILLLRQLARVGPRAAAERWAALAEQAEQSFHSLFWRENLGYYADLLPGRERAKRALERQRELARQQALARYD